MHLYHSKLYSETERIQNKLNHWSKPQWNLGILGMFWVSSVYYWHAARRCQRQYSATTVQSVYIRKWRIRSSPHRRRSAFCCSTYEFPLQQIHTHTKLSDSTPHCSGTKVSLYAQCPGFYPYIWWAQLAPSKKIGRGVLLRVCTI